MSRFAAVPSVDSRRELTTSSRWPNLFLLVISVLAAFVVAEIVLRIFPQLAPTPAGTTFDFARQQTYISKSRRQPRENANFIPDTATGWRMRPHHQFSWSQPGIRYISNAQGFRSPWEFSSTDSRSKIILAGDSFTFGSSVNYEETFGALIESRLGPESVVYNLAMPGFGVDQMWLSVKYQALPLKPTLVVVAFIDDDLQRSQRLFRVTEGRTKPAFKLSSGRLVPRNLDDSNPLVGVLQHSRLWGASQFVLLEASHYFPVTEWWNLNAVFFKQIQADCQKSGVTVLFVYIPESTRPRFPLLRSFMRKHGANFIDMNEGNLLPVDGSYVFDGHLSSKGHRHVADAVVKWMRENLSASGSVPR